MHRARIDWFTAGLRLTAALCVLVFGVNASGALAADELQQELLPGLDLWPQNRGTAPYWESQTTTPNLVSRAKRHREFLQGGVPLEYRNRRNPYPTVTMAVRDGGQLYTAHCAACHGPKGWGDGDAGSDLTPSPALLAYMVKEPRSVDEYLLWTISEGGAPFGTEMPTFKGILTERQIWQIVTYMRADFPGVPEAGQD